MTSNRSKFQEDTRFRIFRLLEENPEISQRELAEAVGVSVSGMHYVLNALVEKGFVKFGNFTSSQDKRRYAYILTPKGVSEKIELTRGFLKRKLEEYESLKSEIEDIQNSIDKQTPHQFKINL